MSGQSKALPGLLSDEHVLHRVSEQLAGRFEGVFAAETVERYVFESYTALKRTANVHVHVPSITEHFARDRLTALAQSKGRVTKDVPEVLFVCVQNAGRSQMAAALLDRHGQGRVHVRSAGSRPADAIHPQVVDAMARVGVDMEGHYPKPLTDDVVRAADVIITMGCGDACPIYPDKHYEDWALSDPAEGTLDDVEAVRSEIDQRVRRLLAELTT